MRKKKKIIFVFGSNLAGRHGKGAALEALQKYGAIKGKGKGRMGNAYGIPTKDKKLRVMSLTRIQYYVSQFKVYAARHPKLRFLVTPVGCGLAGYTPKDIAPMFLNSPPNVKLPKEFKEVGIVCPYCRRPM